AWPDPGRRHRLPPPASRPGPAQGPVPLTVSLIHSHFPQVGKRTAPREGRGTRGQGAEAVRSIAPAFSPPHVGARFLTTFLRLSSRRSSGAGRPAPARYTRGLARLAPRQRRESTT